MIRPSHAARWFAAAMTLFSCVPAHGATLSGVAENGEGQPVPFANVILRIPAVERRAGVSSVEVLGAIRAVIASESGQWEIVAGHVK